MRKFFAPNLGCGGRIFRAVAGVGLVLIGLAISPYTHLVCTALVVLGGFTIYEAARGWCVMRACGLRTRL